MRDRPAAAGHAVRFSAASLAARQAKPIVAYTVKKRTSRFLADGSSPHQNGRAARWRAPSARISWLATMLA